MTCARLWVVEFEWEGAWKPRTNGYYLTKDAAEKCVAGIVAGYTDNASAVYRVACYERVEPRKEVVEILKRSKALRKKLEKKYGIKPAKKRGKK
jgi:hypothetical protein